MFCSVIFTVTVCKHKIKVNNLIRNLNEIPVFTFTFPFCIEIVLRKWRMYGKMRFNLIERSEKKMCEVDGIRKESRNIKDRWIYSLHILIAAFLLLFYLLSSIDNFSFRFSNCFFLSRLLCDSVNVQGSRPHQEAVVLVVSLDQ